MNENSIQAPDPEKIRLLKQAVPLMALARNVYDTDDTHAPDGWKILACTDEPTRRHVDGFFARVYEKTGAGGLSQYAVAFRGTDELTDIKDLHADMDIVLGKLPAQYNDGRQFVEDVCKENNIKSARMIFTGHSLGGYLAVSIGAALGASHIWTFNAPAPYEKIEDIFDGKKPDAFSSPGKGWVQIRSTDDLVSEWGDDHGATTININTAGAPHSLANLQQAVAETIRGEPVTPVSRPDKKGMLSSVFNVVSNVADAFFEKLATSSFVEREISKVVDNVPSQVAQKKQQSGPFTMG